MAHRNRYLEVMDDGQMTPREYPNITSYVKYLRCSIGRMDGDINLGAGGLGHSLRVGWRDCFP